MIVTYLYKLVLAYLRVDLSANMFIYFAIIRFVELDNLISEALRSWNCTKTVLDRYLYVEMFNDLVSKPFNSINVKSSRKFASAGLITFLWKHFC